MSRKRKGVEGGDGGDMRVSLLTDAPKHNLALMKLSAHHKAMGDDVLLNMPIVPADYTYASVLFEKNEKLFIADEYGGPVYDRVCLPKSISNVSPDYTLFGTTDFSLGYTFRPCYRHCDFCKVGDMLHPDTVHHSIWEFHNSKFDKICLLNNNTFFDKQWKETFEEIWDANLTVIDENGYDLRLLNDCKVDALKRTKFDGRIHFAWDRMEDESKIIMGLELLKKYKITGRVYVLIGFDTTIKDDLYRCQKIVDTGHDPYIMPYNQIKFEKHFKRFIDSFMWRKYKTMESAWKDWR